MAVGTVTGTRNVNKAVCLMTAQTANTGAPTDTTAGTDSTEGVPAYPATGFKSSSDGAFYPVEFPEISTLVISSSAGSDTLAGTFTLWGFKKVTGCWYPITVNGGAALAETATDVIRFQQAYTNLGHYDRLFLQLASVGGTLTAFEAYLITAMGGPAR